MVFHALPMADAGVRGRCKGKNHLCQACARRCGNHHDTRLQLLQHPRQRNPSGSIPLHDILQLRNYQNLPMLAVPMIPSYISCSRCGDLAMTAQYTATGLRVHCT
jgi:hypothetical protein